MTVSSPLHRRALAATAALGVLTLAGCTADSSAAVTSAAAASSTSSSAAVSFTASPAGSAVTPVTPALTVTGPGGETVTLTKRPERIVCLTGICDDVLVELGLQPVGTTTPDLLALPEFLGDKAAEVATVDGSFGNEDVASIAALKPDLVIGLAGAHDQLRSAVEQFAPLWLMDVTGWQDSVGYLRAMATLTDRPEQQVTAEQAFTQSLDRAHTASTQQGLAATRAMAMYSSGAGMGVNTQDDLLGGLLGEVFAYPWPNKGGGWDTAQAYSVEEILAVDPQLIFVQSFTSSPDAPKASTELAATPVWQQIDAVRTGKVVEVDTALWTAGRGPRALGLVLDQAVAAAQS
ncbi:ABC transporter substrate-binding protein [Nakamurella sp.]|uniref:ABC transporter substrate-binding protein n=1 Tax=Nakamurella sp. TaxID=1869182 RepID=UPI0037851AA0